MSRSKIEWTEQTWNPTTGCTKVSHGCRHCYAETMARRLQAMGAKGYENGFDLTIHPDRLHIPLHRKKPTMYFVNSMSDLFHPYVPMGFVMQVFAIEALCPQHIFLHLTKRPERMLEMLTSEGVERWIQDCAVEISGSPCAAGAAEDAGWPLPNAWLGVSIENQPTADERISLLLKTPAAVRFVSYEPALGSVDLNARECLIDKRRFKLTLGNYIDWVICGCESGPRRRPPPENAHRELRDQCVAADVAFFLKQWPDEHGQVVKMPELDGRVWSEMPVVST